MHIVLASTYSYKLVGYLFLSMFPLLILSVFAIMASMGKANVIGIDFASDAVKVAIVQPGTPLEVVTNFQSKRKTPTCITFYRGERLFGSDSYALMGRKPDLTFSKLYRMLGRTPDHPVIKELPGQYFPYQIYGNESTSITTLKQESTSYTPEELIAMMLQHVKDMTLNFGGKAIKDCVITVPSSFTQHERMAVYTAAEIADLKVLTLIEENTAAALHLGMDRVFEEPTVVMFFNMGAGSLQVTIVSYSSYSTKEMGKNKTIGQFEVVGKGWDASLGGFNFDVRLAELLADRFNTVWNKKKSGAGKDIRDYIQPMTKLRIQATKVKEVLSANTEFPVKAEQLYADVDLNTKVSRAEFEAACEDLFARVTVPIDKALAMAGMTLADINQVELLGGAVRMPKVKQLLDSYFKGSKADVGQHMNGDESMALGAAFRAANLSTAFRVRKVGMSDVTSFGVSVRLEQLDKDAPPIPTFTAPEGIGSTSNNAEGGDVAEEKSGGLFSGIFGGGNSATKKNNPTLSEEKSSSAVATESKASDSSWSKFTTLFPVKSAVPSKTKTVAFHYDQDIQCRIEYSDSDTSVLPPGTDSLVATYNITGVADFARENAPKGLGVPKVHLSFGLDGSGLIQLLKAEATLELPAIPEAETAPLEDNETASENAQADSASNSSGSMFTNSSDEPDGVTNTSAADTVNTTSTTTPKTTSKKPKPNKKQTKKADNMLRRPLTVNINHEAVSPPVWTPALIADSKSKLRALQEADEARRAKEAALNELEAYLYQVKNKLIDQEEDLRKISTDEQRQEVVDLANEVEDWLYGEGRDQTVSVYDGRKTELSVLAKAIFNRYDQLTLRPEAVSKAYKRLNDISSRAASWAEKLPHITDEEKEELMKVITEAQGKINELVEAQEVMSPYDTPAFVSSDVLPLLKPALSLYDKLSKKPKPAPPVVLKNDTDAGNSTNGTDSEDTADDGPIKVELEPNQESANANNVEYDSDNSEQTTQEGTANEEIDSNEEL